MNQRAQLWTEVRSSRRSRYLTRHGVERLVTQLGADLPMQQRVRDFGHPVLADESKSFMSLDPSSLSSWSPTPHREFSRVSAASYDNVNDISISALGNQGANQGAGGGWSSSSRL
jgi:hypothetical protein